MSNYKATGFWAMIPAVSSSRYHYFVVDATGHTMSLCGRWDKHCGETEDRKPAPHVDCKKCCDMLMAGETIPFVPKVKGRRKVVERTDVLPLPDSIWLYWDSIVRVKEIGWNRDMFGPLPFCIQYEVIGQHQARLGAKQVRTDWTTIRHWPDNAVDNLGTMEVPHADVIYFKEWDCRGVLFGTPKAKAVEEMAVKCNDARTALDKSIAGNRDDEAFDRELDAWEKQYDALKSFIEMSAYVFCPNKDGVWIPESTIAALTGNKEPTHLSQTCNAFANFCDANAFSSWQEAWRKFDPSEVLPLVYTEPQ